MIRELSNPLKVFLRAVENRARNLGWHIALLFMAGLINAAGCGFVIFASFAGLRLVIGPELSGLTLGLVLLGIAAFLVKSTSITVDGVANDQSADTPPPASVSPPFAPPDQPNDPVTLAVFTAAFVLGRQLANRRRN